MKIIFDNNGTPEPYSFSQLKADNPNVSFGKEFPDSQINPYDVYRVQDTTKPATTATHFYVEGTPVFNNPVWDQAWDAVAFTTEQIAVNDLNTAGVTRNTLDVATYLSSRGITAPLVAINIEIDDVVTSSGLTLSTVSGLINS